MTYRLCDKIKSISNINQPLRRLYVLFEEEVYIKKYFLEEEVGKLVVSVIPLSNSKGIFLSPFPLSIALNFECTYMSIIINKAPPLLKYLVLKA